MKDQQDVFASREYKRSRMAYRFECSFESFTMLFMTDAFLVTLLQYMGLKDSVIGVVVSFTSLAYFSQILAAIVAQRITNTKKVAILFHTSAQLIQTCLFLLPFLPILKQIKGTLSVIAVLVLYCFNYFATPIIYNWGNYYVDPHKRADFSAVKEIMMMGGGMVLTLVFGYVLDAFKKDDNVEGGFIFCAIGIFAFCIADLICLLLIKNLKISKEEQDKVSLGEVFKSIFSSRGYVSIIIVTVLWNTAMYMTVGFLGTYMLGELEYSVFAVQVINIVGNFARLLASKPFGRFSDKHSFARGVELGLIFAAAAFLMLAFTTPQSKLLIIGYVVLYGVCNAGIGGNLLNISYNYVDSRYFLQASAIRSSIGGACGICITLIGSRLMEMISANGNNVFGIPLYTQQLMGIISFTTVIIAIIYTHFVLAKHKTMLQ